MSIKQNLKSCKKEYLPEIMLAILLKSKNGDFKPYSSGFFYMWVSLQNKSIINNKREQTLAKR